MRKLAIPEKLKEIIMQLEIKNEEKLMIEKIANDILVKVDEVIPVGDPKEIYEAARHLLGRGKLLRGILVMLINGVYGFPNREKTLRLAAAIELLHTASLIHDDIIDGAKMRRGVEAVHKKFGLNIAIVSTDLLISLAYNICADMGEDVIKLVSDAGKRMSEAEVLECIIENPKVDDYFKIIDGKSAALIESACACSAIISNASDEEIFSFRRYGKLIGRVLQIRDDILDYISNESITGKSNPLIYGLKRVNIVDVLVREKKIKSGEAITSAYELGKGIVTKALEEINFIEPIKRRMFEKFVTFVLERLF